MKILGSLYCTFRVETDLWINDIISKKLQELITDCRGAWKGQRQTPPQAERDHPSTSSSSSSWWAALWWKVSSWNGRCSFCDGFKVFSRAGNGDPFTRDGVCAQDTKHAMSRSHTRDFSRFLFSVCRVSVCQSLSRAQWCSQKTCVFIFSEAWHTVHFSDDSAMIEHFFISHLHSNLLFDQTINGLRRFTECVFRFLGRSVFAYTLHNRANLESLVTTEGPRRLSTTRRPLETLERVLSAI